MKLRSFKSSENINEKDVGPYRSFWGETFFLIASFPDYCPLLPSLFMLVLDLDVNFTCHLNRISLFLCQNLTVM